MGIGYSYKEIGLIQPQRRKTKLNIVCGQKVDKDKFVSIISRMLPSSDKNKTEQNIFLHVDKSRQKIFKYSKMS